MANPYKDANGHWTTKENDGGPCQHTDGKHQTKIEDGKYYLRTSEDADWEEVSYEEFNEVRQGGYSPFDEADDKLDFGFDEDEEGHDYELDALRERDEKGLNNDFGPEPGDEKPETTGEKSKLDYIKEYFDVWGKPGQSQFDEVVKFYGLNEKEANDLKKYFKYDGASESSGPAFEKARTSEKTDYGFSTSPTKFNQLVKSLNPSDENQVRQLKNLAKNYKEDIDADLKKNYGQGTTLSRLQDVYAELAWTISKLAEDTGDTEFADIASYLAKNSRRIK